MRTLLIFLLSISISTILFPQSVKAQSVFPSYSDAPRWNVYQTFWFEDELAQYNYTSDTVLCGFNYSALYDQLIRNEGKKVFRRSGYNCDDPEYLLYDFDLIVGQKVSIDVNNAVDGFIEFRVDSIDSVTYFGINRKRLTLAFDHNGGFVDDISFDVMHWIECIGSDWSPFYYLHGFHDSGESTYSLQCFDSSGIQMYGYPYEGGCDIIISVPPQPETLIKVYPNPATNFITFDPGSNAGFSFTMHSFTSTVLSGKLSSGKQIINIETLPAGIYILEISDPLGIITYKTNFIKM